MTRGALDQIAAGYRDSAVPPDDDGAATGIDVSVQIAATLGRVAQALEAEACERERRRQAMRQVPIQPQQIPLTLAGGTGGILDVPDAYMLARTGYNASIRRLSAWGFSAGTVQVWLESPAGELLCPFSSAGVNTVGRGEMLLQPGERIVWVAAGITGFVQVGGSYDLFESWYLPYYIG